MKLLSDQNLSRHLVSHLTRFYPDSVHVATVGLGTATDSDVWDYAGDHGLVIVSKDSDFRQFAFLLGSPPKTIWLRVGNQTTDSISALLINSVEIIKQFVASEESALLVLANLNL